MQKNINKFIIAAALVIGLFIAVQPVLASVAEIENQLHAAAEEGAGYGKPQDPRTTAATIIRAGLQLIGIVFIILIIYAGATWMMAGGNEDSIEKAKKIIKAAIIGLIIVVSAYSITYFAAYLAAGGRADALRTGTLPESTMPFNPN
jgi:cytochrome bd-type quinol oxidase subunit 2